MIQRPPSREVVLAILQDGEWHSIRDMAHRAQKEYGVLLAETGLSARVRELRQPEHGGHTVIAQRTPGGHAYVYRLL